MFVIKYELIVKCNQSPFSVKYGRTENNQTVFV